MVNIGVLFPIWWFYNLRIARLGVKLSQEEVNDLLNRVKETVEKVVPDARVCVPEAAMQGEYVWVPEILVVLEKELMPSIRAEVMSRILPELSRERPYVTVHLTDKDGAKRYEASVGKLVCK